WSQYGAAPSTGTVSVAPAISSAASGPDESARSEPAPEPTATAETAGEAATDETATNGATTGEAATDEAVTRTAAQAARDPGPHTDDSRAGESRADAPGRARVAVSRRRPRASTAPTGEPGELRIGLRARGGGSLPDDAWAEVRIDGRPVDGSPPLSLRLPPGRHVVEVRPYGAGRRLTRTVEIPSGGREIAIFAIEER